MTKCKGCGREIQWIVTKKNNKAAPFDMQPHTITTPEGETHTGFISHFATCPVAQRFRKG